MTTSRFLSTGIALALVLGAGPALAAEDEPVDMPENIIAKMARMRAKSGDMSQRDRDDDASPSRKAAKSASCGSLNIGNVEAPRAGAPAPKEVFVYVKGPVINANNKCSR